MRTEEPQDTNGEPVGAASADEHPQDSRAATAALYPAALGAATTPQHAPDATRNVVMSLEDFPRFCVPKERDEQRQRFESLFEHCPDAVAEVDRCGRVVRANAAAYRIGGYSPEEVIGRPFLPMVLPEDREHVTRSFERAITGEAQSRDVTILHRDGRRIDLHVSSFPLVIDGAIAGLWVFAQDITARRRAEHVARGQARAMGRMLDALAAASELDAYLGQVLKVIGWQLGARATLLWFYEPLHDTVSLHMRCLDGEITNCAEDEDSPAGTPQPSSSRPLWIEARRRREPLVVPDITQERRLGDREWLLEHEIRSLLLVPLLAGGEAIGWMTIGVPDYRVFPPEEIQLAQALAQQVTLAVRLTRLAEQGRQGAIMSERNRMAREIHDTLAQGFTGILIQLEAAEDLLAEDPALAGNHLNRARELARASLAEARRSVWALRPSALEQADLSGALAALCRRMAVGSGVDQEFNVRGRPYRLRPEMEANLLRIGIEALTNALKHGKPDKVRVDLRYAEDLVTLTVIDNGCGFDVPARTAEDGFGLISMRERAESIGARFTIRSHPGKGTVVFVEAVAPGAPNLHVESGREKEPSDDVAE